MQPKSIFRMQAVAINSYGGKELRKLLEPPIREMSPTEVPIKVEAAGVGVWDAIVRQGFMKDVAPAALPLMLGGDGASTVAVANKPRAVVKTGNRDLLKETQPNRNFRMIAVRTLVGLALCLAVADRATGSPQDPSEPISSETKPTKSVNQEITDLLKAYEQALNSHDPKAVMALYGSDPIFIPQNAEAFIGREAVQARYQHGSQTIKVNVVFTIHEIVEMGELAYGRTTSAGQQEVLATHKISREANNELFIFRREQGQWKIHRYMFAASNPPAAN